MIIIERNENIATQNGLTNLVCGMRSTWREMATWTWIYLMSVYTKFDEFPEAAFNHLYYIPQNMGVLLQYVFGYENAQKYLQLVSNQLISTKNIIDSEIAGNNQATEDNVKLLYQNADERAKFVSSINPLWEEGEVRNLLYTYHRYTLMEITDLLSGNYTEFLNMFELLLHHADNVGDYFAEGLVNFINFGQYQQPKSQSNAAV